MIPASSCTFKNQIISTFSSSPDRTYNPQLRITCSQLLGMTRVRSLSLQNLVPPSYPSLHSALAQVNLLRFVSARICVKHNPKTNQYALVTTPTCCFGTYCCSSAFACSSGPPPLTLGTRVSAAQFKMCWPSMEHCRSAAYPSV